MDTTTTTSTINPEAFIGYEYKNIVTSRRLASIYLDYFSCFGWEVEDSNINRQLNKASITFKRNRKLKNRMEVDRYQRQFEEGVDNIAHLEGSKTTKASIVAYAVGLVATALMALATFAFLEGLVVICAVLAIPAALGWLLAYVAYVSLSKKRSTEIIPEVDREFDNLYNTCEKAQALMA